MPNFTDLTGLAGIALALLAAAVRLPGVARLQARFKLVFALAVLGVLATPFGALSALEYVRGLSGDLSFVSLVLLGCGMCRAFEVLPPVRATCAQSAVLRSFAALAAVLLYPFALGLGMFDPYRLGFGNVWLIAALLALALLAWRKKQTLLVLALALATLAWSVGWYESNNLWDYLIDPWVAIYALSGLVIPLVMSVLRKVTRR